MFVLDLGASMEETTVKCTWLYLEILSKLHGTLDTRFLCELKKVPSMKICTQFARVLENSILFPSFCMCQDMRLEIC